MGTLMVEHRHGDQFVIDVRGHQVFVDQPESDGGTDMAPTPTELLVASLASCVAFYARRFLARHELPCEGLRVSAAYEMASAPARVGCVDIKLELPGDVPAERRAALLAVARHCTVHNTLAAGPNVRVELAEEDAAA